jgi:hypothetical protein
MKPLYFISAQPSDLLFLWQIRTQLYNFRGLGYSALYRILVFVRKGERLPEEWKQLERDYPGASFYYYLDTDNIQERIISKHNYASLVRPYLLANHFYEFPELKEAAIFYLDSDVLFTSGIDFTPFLLDDINYGSDCRSYMSAQYFDSKIKDVLPGKKEEYKERDVLNECCSLIGIDRVIVEANELSGNIGAQYLLKDIDSDFWKDVLVGAIQIANYLRSINKTFFESDRKGIQAPQCSDMRSLLWNLWKKGKQTKTDSEFNFSWSTSKAANKSKIFHDAGITKEVADQSEYPTKIFYKHNYKNSIPDLNPDQYQNGLKNHWYVTQIKKALS